MTFARPTGRPTLALLLLVVAALVAACGPTAGPLGTPNSPAVTPTPSDEPTPSDVAPGSPTPAPTDAPTEPPSEVPSGQPSGSPAPTATPSTAGATVVRAYFMLGSFTGNPGLVPALREVPETKAVARAAMNELLGGPEGSEVETSPAMYSGIPDGTKLIDIAVADGVATVTLSGEFNDATANAQGATARAQVVYTLTQFSSVKKVRISIDGATPEPAATRADFQQLGILPAIFVDRPAWNAAAGNPVRVTGIANVFEATFQVQVLDGKGTVLAEQEVMASCGTGCWGSFKSDVPYTLGKAQYGTLRVFDLSAKDGSPENVTEYRVWLTPAG